MATPKRQPAKIHILDDLVEIPPYDAKLWERAHQIDRMIQRQVEASKENFLGVMAQEALAEIENIKSPGALLPLINAALEGMPLTDGSLLFDGHEDD